MSSMEQSRKKMKRGSGMKCHAKENGSHFLSRKENRKMEEKAYKTMGKTGAFNLVLGICTLVAGITVGVMLIIHGAKLLGSRKKLMF